MRKPNHLPRSHDRSFTAFLFGAACAALALSQPAVAAGLNLVEEGDFEDLRGTEFVHWRPAGFAGGTSKIRFVSEQEGGNTFARIHIPENQPEDARNGAFKMKDPVVVDPAWKKFTVKLRIRTKAWRKNPPGWHGAGLMVASENAKGEQISHTENFFVQEETPAWKELTRTVVVRPGTTLLRLDFANLGVGTVDIDDVQIIPE